MIGYCPYCSSENIKWTSDGFICQDCFEYFLRIVKDNEMTSNGSAPEEAESTSPSSTMNVNTGVDNMPKMYNVIVSDKGQKAVPIGTLWYDESRKAVISGYISKDDLSNALKNKVVTCTKGDAKSRNFAGKDVFRIAAFPVVRRSSDTGGSGDGL